MADPGESREINRYVDEDDQGTTSGGDEIGRILLSLCLSNARRRWRRSGRFIATKSKWQRTTSECSTRANGTDSTRSIAFSWENSLHTAWKSIKSFSFPCSSVEFRDAALPVTHLGLHIDHVRLINLLFVGAIVDWLFQSIITAAMFGVEEMRVHQRVARQYRLIEIHWFLTIERILSFLRNYPKRNRLR